MCPKVCQKKLRETTLIKQLTARHCENKVRAFLKGHGKDSKNVTLTSVNSEC